MHILIATAVEQELQGTVALLDNAVELEIGGRRVMSGSIAGIDTRLVATGAGIANTVQTLTALVEKDRPAMILQTGCAGIFRESGLGLGDVGIATEEIDTHLGIEPEEPSAPLLPLPFPILPGNIRGRYPIEERLVDRAQKALPSLEGKGIKIATGPFLTVATITATDNRALALYSHYRPVMEAMEGAGAAHVCRHYGIPFLEIRAASNFVGKRERAQWDLPRSFAAVTHMTGRFMEHFEFEHLLTPGNKQ